MLKVLSSHESSVSNLAEDQEVVDTADAEDTAEDHRQVVLEVDTAEDHRQVVLVVVAIAVDRVLESHLEAVTEVVLALEAQVDIRLLVVMTMEVEDTRVVNAVKVDTRVDKVVVLDIVVLRVEAMEVTHSATMVHLAHLAVSTQIVHVHHAENNSLAKKSTIKYTRNI
jgi:hypothetical protein